MERHVVIVAGFGLRTGATVASLRAALTLACEGGKYMPTLLAVPEDRAMLGARLADACGVPLVPIAPDVLAAIDTPTRSAPSVAARGTGSVAEAAALAAAGTGARLLVTRRIAPDRMATCAIACGTCREETDE